MPVTRPTPHAAVAPTAVATARSAISRVSSEPSDASGPSRSSASGEASRGLAQRDRERRRHVGEQVDEQQLPGVQRRAARERGARDREGDLAEVAADEDRHRVAHRAPHRAALDDRVDDRLDAVVDHHDVGGHARRRVGAAAERDADVGEPDGRRVVGAVARHRHRPADALVGLDDPHLLHGGDPREDRDVLDDGVELVVGELVEVGPGEHPVRRLGVVGGADEPELGGDRLGGARVVAGDHRHTDTGGPQPVDRLAAVAAHRVGEADEAEELEALDGRAVREVGVRDRVGLRDREHAQPAGRAAGGSRARPRGAPPRPSARRRRPAARCARAAAPSRAPPSRAMKRPCVAWWPRTAW